MSHSVLWGRPRPGEAALRTFVNDPRYEGLAAHHRAILPGRYRRRRLRASGRPRRRHERKDQVFDRNFYLGQAAALAGDMTEAKRRFAAVVGTGSRQYLEFNIAAAEIGALGKLDDADKTGSVPTGEVSAAVRNPAHLRRSK